MLGRCILRSLNILLLAYNAREEISRVIGHQTLTPNLSFMIMIAYDSSSSTSTVVERLVGCLMYLKVRGSRPLMYCSGCCSPLTDPDGTRVSEPG